MQLTAIGFVITAIFDEDSLLLVVALLAVMVGFGAFTARARARHVPGAAGAAADRPGAVGDARRSGSCSRSGSSRPEPRYLVPVGGMVIGNAMTASAVALNRLGDEMRARGAADRGDARARRDLPPGRRAERPAGAALGDDRRSSTRRRRPGLIFFPGTMVGMLLAGADPTDAVRLQLILLYVLLGAVAISALVSTTLAYRNFFTPAQQLRDRGDGAGGDEENVAGSNRAVTAEAGDGSE